MSLQEIQQNVRHLPRQDLMAFAQWFEEFLADDWDRQIEEDARSGRLDAAVQRAKEQFEAGQCTPL